MFVGVCQVGGLTGCLCFSKIHSAHSIPNLFEAANWDHHGVFWPSNNRGIRLGSQLGNAPGWRVFPMSAGRFAGQFISLEFVEKVIFCCKPW